MGFKIKSCRICGGTHLQPFLSLGKMPIPNGFLTKNELNNPEVKYPLEACVCESCNLVLLTHVVPAELMFKNYLYIPSTSESMLRHFQTLAEEIITKFGLKRKDLIVDIGSNDGTLLSFFKIQEIKVLGIDPATNLAQLAKLKGIETINDFFTPKLAKEIIAKSGKAKIVTATNVMGHINDLHSFCEAVKILLEKDGIFVVEFPYLLDLLEKNEFDTIYHEHLSYFSLKPLIKLFKGHDLSIAEVQHLPTHGGSLRIFATKKSSSVKRTPSIKEFTDQESDKKLGTKYPYLEFSKGVAELRKKLIKLLNGLHSKNKKIAGYGASAKGNVLLNYCGLGKNIINYIVDSIPYKQGRYTPGTHIPIFPENRLEKDQPDYTLLLSWNFAEEIFRKQIKYRESGGRFILTVPYLREE